MIARSEGTVESTLSALAGADNLAMPADATDEAALRAALDKLVERFGVPEILVYGTVAPGTAFDPDERRPGVTAGVQAPAYAQGARHRSGGDRASRP